MKETLKPDVVELTKQTFAKEFLKISPKTYEISEILWFMFKAGGTVPIDIILARFPNFSEDIKHLVNGGIIQVKEEKLVMFTERFEEKLLSKDLTKITNSDVTTILLDNYWSKLSNQFGLGGLENALAAVLSSVIISSSPNQPAFLSKVLRTCDAFLGESEKVLKSVIGDPQLILDYYLWRSLELVQPVGNFGVNLSEKAKELVQKNKDLWEIYSGKLKESKRKLYAKKK